METGCVEIAAWNLITQLELGWDVQSDIHWSNRRPFPPCLLAHYSLFVFGLWTALQSGKWDCWRLHNFIVLVKLATAVPTVAGSNNKLSFSGETELKDKHSSTRAWHKCRGPQDITTDPDFVSSLKKIINVNIREEDRFQHHISQ